MNISTISGLTGAQIESYLTEFNAAHKADGVSAEFKVNEAGETLVVVTGKSGETRSIAITDIPEIDSPEDIPGDEAAEALDKLANNLTELANELKANPKTPSASMNVFCDIFALIHLLMEVAQQQQKTAAAIRQQGHAAVQANLQAQANSIRDQADSAYTLGMVSAAISSFMTLASIAMLGIGISKQNNAAKSADMDGAESNLTDIKQQLSDVKETSKAQEGQLDGPNRNGGMDPKTKDLLKELGYDVSDPEKARAEFMKDYMPETSKTEPEVNEAKQKYVDAQKAADDFKVELDDAKQRVQNTEELYNNKKTELETAKTKAQTALEDFNKAEENAGIEEKYQELKDSIKPDMTADQLAESTEGTDHELTPEEAQKVLDCAKKHAAVDLADNNLKNLDKTEEAQNYETAKRELTEAEQTYASLNKAADDAHAAWQVKAMKLQEAQNADKNALKDRLDKVNAEIEANNKQIPKGDDQKPQATKSLKTAQKLMKEIEKAQDRDTTSLMLDGLKNKLDGAREKVSAAANAMGLSKDGRSGKKYESLVNICGQLSNSITAFINTAKERNAGLAEAHRKEIEIELDKGRAMIEQAEDLRQSAKKQVDDFIHILSSIQQIQTQTNLQMIRG